MTIAIIDSRYVGLVTSTCFSDVGIHVVGDTMKVTNIAALVSITHHKAVLNKILRMKIIITGIVAMLLFTNHLAYAQTDTPMEVLINIANSNERFETKNLFLEDYRPSTYLNKFLKNYSTLTIDRAVLAEILKERNDNVQMNIKAPYGADLDVKISAYDIRGENFQIIEKSNGTERAIALPDAIFYRGILERGSDALAGMSFFEDQAYGLFSTLQQGNIVLALDPINPGKQKQNYILYFESDLLIERDANCGSEELRPVDDQATEAFARENVYETCRDIGVKIEATNALYTQKGGTVATAQYISAFFNNVSIIYRNDGIYTSLSSIAVNKTSDIYAGLPSSMLKLNAFGDDERNGYQRAGAELAHLVDYDPGKGGIAWINTLCTDYTYYSAQNYHYGAYAYSSIEATQQDFPDYSLTVFMFSHEMGHNLGSYHTQWCGWSGGAIDNCAAPEKLTGQDVCAPGPAPTNGGTIMSYCHATSYGINYSSGFGTQPGNRIRSVVASKTCAETYIPTDILATSPNKTLTANRECTDDNGWTNYYDDKNTASAADDEWLLSVKKGSENIGNLDDGTLLVQVLTSSNAGSGSTHINNPGYAANGDWHVMNRWFDLVPTNEPNNPVTVKFPYTSDDFNDVLINQASIQAHSDLTFYKINNPGDPNPDHGHVGVGAEDIKYYTNGASASLTEWKYSNAGGGNHIAEFQVNSFSGGGGGFSENTPASALPVELLKFTARKKDNTAVLDWATSTELNNDFFSIERSSDGINFELIGLVKGEGTSSSRVDYTFTDRNPQTGINYYRLMQTDFNGVFEYLGINVLEFERKGSAQIFPNPLNGSELTISYEAEKGDELELLVINLAGQKIMNSFVSIEKGYNTISLNMENVPAGIYFVQMISNAGKITRKLIKG